MSCCEECDRGEHGVAIVRSTGRVVCACCYALLAPYIMEDHRPKGERVSFMEAAREGMTHLFAEAIGEER